MCYFSFLGRYPTTLSIIVYPEIIVTSFYAEERAVRARGVLSGAKPGHLLYTVPQRRDALSNAEMLSHWLVVLYNLQQ